MRRLLAFVFVVGCGSSSVNEPGDGATPTGGQPGIGNAGAPGSGGASNGAGGTAQETGGTGGTGGDPSRGGGAPVCTDPLCNSPCASIAMCSDTLWSCEVYDQTGAFGAPSGCNLQQFNCGGTIGWRVLNDGSEWPNTQAAVQRCYELAGPVGAPCSSFELCANQKGDCTTQALSYPCSMLRFTCGTASGYYFEQDGSEWVSVLDAISHCDDLVPVDPCWSTCVRGYCVEGECVSCPPGQLDCDRNATNQCETFQNASNCGSCGRVCNAQETCTWDGRPGYGYYRCVE